MRSVGRRRSMFWVGEVWCVEMGDVFYLFVIGI